MTSKQSSWISAMLVLFAAFLLSSDPATVQARQASEAQQPPERFFSAIITPRANLAFFQSSGKDEAPLPDGKGKELVQKYCITCHAAKVWTKQHNTKQQWSDVLDDMVSKGLDASDEDIETMTAYLTTNFGPVKGDPAAPPSEAAPR